MQLGKLNKRISIISTTQVSDGMGGFNETDTTVATIWAAIWPLTGKEQLQSQQTAMEISHRIRIRYRSGMLSSYRLKFGTRYFNIVSIINPNEENRWLDLMCKEAA